MDTGRRTNTMLFSAMGALAVIGLIWAAPRSLWLPILVAAALVIAAALLVRSGRRTPVAPPVEELFPQVAETDHRRTTTISDVPLPSRLEDYAFLFSATLVWEPTDPEAGWRDTDIAALALDAVLRRAQELTADRDPGQAALVQYELGSALGWMQADKSGTVQAMAKSIRLTLNQDDQVRLDRLSTLRKDKSLWEHERKHEQNKREYLGDDVLKDGGSAVVWWLARNEDQIDKVVENIGALAELASAANNMDVPDAFWPYLPEEHANALPRSPGVSPPADKSATDHFHDFWLSAGFSEGDAGGIHLAHRIADVLVRHDLPDLADEITSRYSGEPDPPADGDEEPSRGG